MDHNMATDARYVRAKYPNISIVTPKRSARGRYHVRWFPGGPVQVIPANSAPVFWAILRQQIEHDIVAGVEK